MDDKKVYEKPEVVEELDLEVRAGSPCPPSIDPLGTDNRPPC